MKKFILGFCFIAMLTSCGSKNEQWEYKVVKVAGHDAEIAADFGTLVFADQTAMLNKMGKEDGNWSVLTQKQAPHFQTSATLSMSRASETIQELLSSTSFSKESATERKR